MKKLFITAVSFLVIANSCFAKIAMPDLSFKKLTSKQEKTEVVVDKQEKEKKVFIKKTEKPKTDVEPAKSKSFFKKLDFWGIEKLSESEKQVKEPKEKKPVKLFSKHEKASVESADKPVSKESKPLKLFSKHEKTTVEPVEKPASKETKSVKLFSKHEKTTAEPVEKPASKESKSLKLFPKREKGMVDSSKTLKSEKIQTKVNIKNPLKKTQPEVGEDFVSKEQVKEELERVHNLSQQAVALYTDNNLDESLKTFMKIPEKYRSSLDYVLMGNILSDLERKEDAIFMYKRAILTDEYNYKAYYNIGNICLNDDKYFMAIDYYKKAVKYAPDFPYAYYNLGCAYIKAGDLNQAKSKLIKAIELKNTEPDFHYNLAYVYKKLDKPKLAQVYLDNYNKLTNGQ